MLMSFQCWVSADAGLLWELPISFTHCLEIKQKMPWNCNKKIVKMYQIVEVCNSSFYFKYFERKKWSIDKCPFAAYFCHHFFSLWFKKMIWPPLKSESWFSFTNTALPTFIESDEQSLVMVIQPKLQNLKKKNSYQNNVFSNINICKRKKMFFKDGFSNIKIWKRRNLFAKMGFCGLTSQIRLFFIAR